MKTVKTGWNEILYVFWTVKSQAASGYLDGSPDIHDYLCADCSESFSAGTGLFELNRDGFEINKKLVRGLDYYTQTVFEIIPEWPDAGSLAGGGRYNNLVEICGGLPHLGSGLPSDWSVC